MIALFLFLSRPDICAQSGKHRFQRASYSGPAPESLVTANAIFYNASCPMGHRPATVLATRFHDLNVSVVYKVFRVERYPFYNLLYRVFRVEHCSFYLLYRAFRVEHCPFYNLPSRVFRVDHCPFYNLLYRVFRVEQYPFYNLLYRGFRVECCPFYNLLSSFITRASPNIIRETKSRSMQWA
jgi:hypothetical protein